MDQSTLIEKLKTTVDLFAGFTEEQLAAVVSVSRVRTFETNEGIIEFGRAAQFLGVLLDGTIQVSVVLDDGSIQTIAVSDAPAIFGEMALMTGERAMADVIAKTRCTALLIPNSVFATQIVSHPAALQQLAKLLTERAGAMGSDMQRDIHRAAETQSNDPYGFTLQSEASQKILVINCGSSSLKYQLFDTESPEQTIKGTMENIGREGGRHLLSVNEQAFESTHSCATHSAACREMIATLRQKNVIRTETEITAVGHRVVHGGETFSEAVVITKKVLDKINQLCPLAPLHNPVNLAGIEAARSEFPDALHVAVFDTTFHHTLPPYAYLYALPSSYYRDHGVRRYGFHGNSHKYVSLKAAQFLKRPYNDLETIVCHLGNGSSICAVDHGRSVDTSMGMTPTAGVPMGTRTGDIDPGALCYISRLENLNANELDTLLNQKSGFLGMSGVSNDMRALTQAAEQGDVSSALTIKTFCYQIRKYIGAYVAAMQGLDVLVFTGGIGEHSTLVRSLACQGLQCMGILIDAEKNRMAVGCTQPTEISDERSAVRVLVIPTNEELMIARQTLGAMMRNRVVGLHNDKVNRIPVEVSAHHVHLSAEHVTALFGEGHTLTPHAKLSQPGQFACKEQVRLVGPKGVVDRVRVLGPTRSKTQVEISMTEQFILGIHPPIRESGDVTGTPGIVLEGPAGTVSLKEGVICAMRHIHMTPKDAMQLGVRDKYVVRVVVEGDRELVFGDVLVRVRPDFRLAMHIDTDEANAANLKTGAIGRIESIQSR
ncbi:MAG: acetate/propionate family kinase, partial [Deltaproteobacteria bacterium]|nr:acetate/propionate family kinase [Deltaproteobacteria bacterium]